MTRGADFAEKFFPTLLTSFKPYGITVVTIGEGSEK